VSVWTREDEHDDEEQRPPPPYVDGAWGRTANPNTAAGELQNMDAFSTGFSRLTGARRTATQVVVWLILFGLALTIVFGVISIVRTW
jgi:uncharacterized membrane protein